MAFTLTSALIKLPQLQFVPVVIHNRYQDTRQRVDGPGCVLFYAVKGPWSNPLGIFHFSSKGIFGRWSYPLAGKANGQKDDLLDGHFRLRFRYSQSAKKGATGDMSLASVTRHSYKVWYAASLSSVTSPLPETAAAKTDIPIAEVFIHEILDLPWHW